MVIIAGYEDELKSCFFSYNAGLESRFVWRFKTDDYDAEQLMNIFLKKVNDANWMIDDKSDIKSDWFKTNMNYFENYGRSMETLFTKTKIAHSKRVFCFEDKYKKKLILKDLEDGLDMYIKSQNKKEPSKNNYLMYM